MLETNNVVIHFIRRCFFAVERIEDNGAITNRKNEINQSKSRNKVLQLEE
jgi:hypothetical protein